jgi:branched-subunit amino acid ABC-type transport system permease component
MDNLGVFLQIVFWGLYAGCIYILLATGLNLIFGVMKIINFAHASFITVGAYAALVASRLGLPPVLAPALAFLAGGLIGAVAERVVVRRLYGRPLDAILATWGLSIVSRACLLNCLPCSTACIKRARSEMVVRIGGRPV